MHGKPSVDSGSVRPLRLSDGRFVGADIAKQILNRGEQMSGPSLVGIHDRRMAERREVRASLAIPLHPRHAVILIGPRAELAETPAKSAIGLLHVDAHQHALLLA